jgi:hypothetical protein
MKPCSRAAKELLLQGKQDESMIMLNKEDAFKEDRDAI